MKAPNIKINIDININRITEYVFFPIVDVSFQDSGHDPCAATVATSAPWPRGSDVNWIHSIWIYCRIMIVCDSCISIYLSIYTYIHTYIHTYICVYWYIYLMYIRCVNIYMHLCIYIYIQSHVQLSNICFMAFAALSISCTFWTHLGHFPFGLCHPGWNVFGFWLPVLQQTISGAFCGVSQVKFLGM